MRIDYPPKCWRNPFLTALVTLILLVTAPALACLQDSECDSNCCRYTQCQAASVCADEAAPAQRAALPLWLVTLPGLALLAAVAWRTRRRLPLRAVAAAGLLAVVVACATAQITRVTGAAEQGDALIADFDSWAAAREHALNAAQKYRAPAESALRAFRERIAPAQPAVKQFHQCIDAVAATAPGADKVAQTCTDDLRTVLVRLRSAEEGMPVVHEHPHDMRGTD